MRPAAWLVWTEREVNQRSAWLRVRAAGSRTWVGDVYVTAGANGRVKVVDAREPEPGVGPLVGRETGQRVRLSRVVKAPWVQAARRKAQGRVVFSEQQGHYFDW